ncbi:protein arginine methyltransferase NDUFAF7, mitochondrial-like [Mytilus edulis]|uniref:protein arginine methyltransferase NDUFAF7, mitochondrial-like n=1 Tax=Mytilus edulis TaxID=6550 RepID=UPI0039EEBA8F
MSSLTFSKITHCVLGRNSLGLFKHGRSYCTKLKENKIMKGLMNKIKATGPLTVADYMREVLTSPSEGYYMTRDVFGQEGDFITSPEISQMFGEMIGIWFVDEWMKNKSPSPVQLVELGPGRGTLADDVLRVFKNFPEINESVSLHMVEISPVLAQIQIEKLTGEKLTSEQSSRLTDGYNSSGLETPDSSEKISKHYYQCKTKYGINAYWYKLLHDVPSEHSLYLAHEFFDALPICKFQKTAEKGWCEVMIDINPVTESTNQFRYVLSPGATPNSTGYLRHIRPADRREHIEVAPYSGVIILQIAERIKQNGCCALIADYGHDGDKTDTLRSFKQHRLHDVLCDPGTADLTADVDFSFFRHLCLSTEAISPFGPITQREFLQNMGIHLRLKMLLQNKDQATKKTLISGFDMITNPEKMGDRFKFFAMLQKKDYDDPPSGFNNLSFQYPVK